MVEQFGVICIAVYRPSWKLLVEQVRSIQGQSLENWRAIIGIDGRDDDLEFRIKELVKDDRRFAVHAYERQVGHYRNFERILREANNGCQWIALADQDDYWYPEKLERMVPYLDECDLVCSQAQLVAVDGVRRRALGETNRSDSSLAALLIDNRVTGSFSLISTDLLKVALPFPAPTDQAFHDHWLGVCAKSTTGLKVIGDVLQDYHQHGTNVIGEETSASFGTRLSRLRTKARSGNPGNALAYLAQHRWGWRVSMAECLTGRVPTTRTVEVFARGRFSVSLLRIVCIEIMRGDVPALRGCALLLGSLVKKDGGMRS